MFATRRDGGRPSDPEPGTSWTETWECRCEICGAVMVEVHCKYICRVCGRTRDCSDP
ncbi:MAG: hypothetical protein AB1486_12180 [Planctomycetota bacterium]